MLWLVNAAAVAIGVSGGLALSFVAVVFAVVGLGPWFTWVPEAVLVIGAAALALIQLGTTGSRARAVTGAVRDGAGAAAIAGAIAGFVAGICFVLFGKGPENVAILLVLGALGGGAVGTATAFATR
jgi:hypothetical protein